MQHFDYGKSLKTLSSYAFSEGYKNVFLNYEGTSAIIWKKHSLNVPDCIYIQVGYSDEYKTYFFLHELGHHELRKDWVKFKSRLPIIAEAESYYRKTRNNKLLRRISYKVAGLEEEYLAWDMGLSLATKFSIPINKQNFYNIKTNCLMGYIKYYSL